LLCIPSDSDRANPLPKSVLTTVFLPIAFFLRTQSGYLALFHIIFSHLWIVAVAFAASSWVHSDYDLLLVATAFSFVAL
jgi:hypothetical protein